jgi:hypothetical protein
VPLKRDGIGHQGAQIGQVYVVSQIAENAIRPKLVCHNKQNVLGAAHDTNPFQSMGLNNA